MGENERPSDSNGLIDRYSLLWEAESERPDPLAFLAAHPPATDRDRVGVFLIDQRERWRRGGTVWTVADYLAAAPDLAALSDFAALLQQGERRARDEWEPTLQGERLPGASPDVPDVENSGPPARGAGPAGPPIPRDDETPAPSVPDPALARTKDANAIATNADLDAFSIDESLEAKARDESNELILSTTRFAIQRRLGSGGMGVVYLAHDRRRGESVALKTMRRVDPLALFRFKHEFRALADLSHPNLVGLHELFATGGLWYFTMELIEGTDFISHVRAIRGPDDVETELGEAGLAAPSVGPGELRPLSPDQAGRLRKALRQLVEGVCALHDAGKLHRDVKPTNVMVTRGGRVVLLDFGLSVELGQPGRPQAAEDQIVGTVAYMSPEQGRNQPVSAASDWYSVGVMLYEALTGRLPFQGKPRQVLAIKWRTDPPAPGTLVPDVPEDLDALCVALLRRAPEERPTGLEILARLDGETAPARAEADGSGPISGAWQAVAGHLVGRERHLEALRDAVEIVRGGQPVTTLVSGRSGTGKSVLLQSFLETLSGEADTVVVSGRCFERESVPYKALDSVVDALSLYLKSLARTEAEGLLPPDIVLLARVFPVLLRAEAVAAAARPAFEPPDQQELRRRAFAALRALLARMGDRKTLVVAIDDLQWGDPENAALLFDLFRPPDAPVLLFLGCYRSEDEETSPFLRVFLPPAAGQPLGPRPLTLGPLNQVESRALALAWLGRDTAVTRAEAHLIARESRGNPFFIAELAKHIQTGGWRSDRLPSAGELQLDAVLWSRVERLPADARRVLEVVAVSSRPLAQADALQAAELGADGRAAVALLRSGRVLRVTGLSRHDALEVYHDRIRETIVAHLAPEALKANHARLARTLEASGEADPEHLAVHFQAAGAPGRAGHYFARAAHRSEETLAFWHAARLYRLALDLLGPEAPDAARLLTKLGDALANAGHGGEAACAYLAATLRADAAEWPELNRRAAMQFLISGRVDEGLEVLRTVLSAMGMRVPRGPRRSLGALLTQRALLRLRGLKIHPRDPNRLAAADLTRIDLCWSAATGLSLIDPILGAEFQARGLLLAIRAGEPYRVVRSLTLEVAHVSTAGTPSRPRVARLLAVAEALAEQVDHPHARGMTLLARAIAALMLGRWPEAQARFDDAETIFRARCTGVAWELDTVHNLALWAITHMGNLGELRGRWPVLLKEARERGDLYATTTLNSYYMTILRLAEDDPEGARRELDIAMGRWSHHGFHVQHSTALRAHVHIDLYRGEGAAARERIRGHWKLHEQSLLFRIQMIRIELRELHARGALAAAAQAEGPLPLLREAERDARRLEREREPWALAHARLILGTVAVGRGRRAAAIEHLKAAAIGYEAVRMDLNAAVARRRLGQVVGGAEGRDLIAAADAWMTGQGIRFPARFATMIAPGYPAGTDPDDDSETNNEVRTRPGST